MNFFLHPHLQPRLDPNRRSEWYHQRDPERMARDLVTAFDMLQVQQREKDRIQRALMNMRLRNAVVVAVVTALVTRAPEIYRFMVHLVK